MEKAKTRQTNLFEGAPKVAELPEPQRQKALLLLGSLLTEALIQHSKHESAEPVGEGGRDQDHR
jgi:hypothetical protein